MLPGDEIRLGFLLLLNATVLASAWLVTRRWTRDPLQRLVDTLLLWFAVQYAAICIPGALHILSNATMAFIALLLSGGMAWLAWRRIDDSPKIKPAANLESSRFILIAGIFAAAISWGVIDKQAYIPVIDSDAMTYHLPAAVHWLQTGKIALLPVWFFNPANTFSPLAGSTFIAWLIAPLGNDSIARAVQWPALALLFLATLQIGRAVGLRMAVAGLMASATVASRPFSSELMSARDDVFLAAFIAVALGGCGGDAIRDRFSPWRLGLAVGLAAATKYTFVFALPVLFLLIDAPVRSGWKWRHWAMAIVTILAIAGPWYLRNVWLTGNPIFPVEVKISGRTLFHGLFESRRSERLSTRAGLQEALIFAFHAPPPPLLAVLIAGWIAAAIGFHRIAWRTPLVRACLVGFPLCLILFLFKSPYGEVRFLFPTLPALFISAGMAICRWVKWPRTAIGIASGLLILSLSTSYKAIEIVGEIVLNAVLISAVTIGLIQLVIFSSRKYPQTKTLVAAFILFIASTLIYVRWLAYLTGYQASQFDFYRNAYPAIAPAWQFIAENVPADATLAYGNTYLIYPLYGSTLQRRLIHIPVRLEPYDFLHLPHFTQPLSGEQIASSFTRELYDHPDRSLWLKRLLDSGATYLYVAANTDTAAPELQFAEQDTIHFTRLFQDPGASVYRVNR